MKFVIPNEPGLSRMKSIVNKRISPILFDDTNLDRMFMVLFERCVKLGATSKPRRKKDFEEGIGQSALDSVVIPGMAKNPNVLNFNSSEGIEILRQWIKTSLAEFTTEGKSKRGSQIDYLKLLSLAVYRSGLPKGENRSSNRNIDETFYKALVAYVGDLPGCENPEREIHNQICNTSLAHGIDFVETQHPWNEPKFNERDLIDINSLAQLRLLEQFIGQAVDSSKSAVEQRNQPFLMPIDVPMFNLAKDFFNITRIYGKRSGVELFEMYKSIFALRLYQLPIIICRSLEAKRSGGEIASLTMFVDFTDDTNSESWRLANKSALDDISSANGLIYEMISVRECEELIKKDLQASEQLQLLDKYKQLDFIYEYMKSEKADRNSYDLIEAMVIHFKNKGDDGLSSLELIEEVKSQSDSNFETLVALILSEVGQRGLKSLRKWLYSVGGLQEQKSIRSISILAGQQKRNTSWTYSMSDSVLNTLLNLCFIDSRGEALNRRELPLKDVLEKLKNEFGILVHEPPLGYSSAEYQRAAQENLIAFKKRLRQLGWFESLSDDFEAQQIRKVG
jgi:hypothetical protein